MTHPGHVTFAEKIAAEQAAVTAGKAKPCAKVCDDGCHGPVTCIRFEHPHDPDADMGYHADGWKLPPGDVAPHVGYDADGQLLQWTCLPGDHDGLTDETRSAARAEVAQQARIQATRDLLANLDVTELVAALREAGAI